ncbi:MAG: hypothetical protein LBD76_07355 [Prevotellaceae bacterium]|jgi:hypothetical protein|nr:hypothetical protein [Prevotellaceae bacterium]
MKLPKIKCTILTLAVIALIYEVLTQCVQLYRWEKIDFEVVAREKMQNAISDFDKIFSETDTLFNCVSAFLQHRTPSAPLNSDFFADGIYIISSEKNVTCLKNRFVADTCERQPWMQQALAETKEWGGPVYDSFLGERMLYCKGTIDARRSMIIVYGTRKIYDKLLETGLTRFGLPYIMDCETNFIAHPLDETRSMLELAYDFNDQTLERMSKDVINSRSTNKPYRHINTVTAQKCNEALYSMPTTGWLLGLSVYDGVSLETGEYQTAMRRGYILVIIITVVLLFMLCFILHKSGVYPALFFAMTVSVVTVYNRYPQQSKRQVSTADKFVIEPQTPNSFCKWEPKRIIDMNSLNGFIENYQRESMILYNQTAKVIPTGIYVYNLSFQNSHDISVTGTLWQKYLISDSDYPEPMLQKYHNDEYENAGIFFPGGHVTNMEFVDSVRIIMEGYPAVLYRWNFDIETEQQMSYSKYPFGKNDISLTLWSNDLDDNTVLTPDLEGYKQMYPTDKPGLDNHFHIKGWDIAGSYYSYSMESYLCNFGNPSIYGINTFPEMVYNISISRKFIDILICKIVPLFVVLALLFTILFVRVKTDGFNNIIGCSGLFFVLVLDHINLRENVLSETIMYLEYGYFFAYILLLLITITSFDIAKNGRSYNAWVDTVLKKHFWTLIFGAMSIVTVGFFR